MNTVSIETIRLPHFGCIATLHSEIKFLKYHSSRMNTWLLSNTDLFSETIFIVLFQLDSSVV